MNIFFVLLNFNVKCIWLRKTLKWKSIYRSTSQIRDNSREKFVFVLIHTFFHLVKRKIYENSNFSKYMIYMHFYSILKNQNEIKEFSHFIFLFVEFSKNMLRLNPREIQRDRGIEKRVTWVNYLRNRYVIELLHTRHFFSNSYDLFRSLSFIFSISLFSFDFLASTLN